MRGLLKRPFILVTAALLTMAAIYLKRDALAQIVIVLILSVSFALLLSPVCSRLEKTGCSVRLSSAIAVLGLIIAAAVFLAAFVPYLVSHTIDILKTTTPSVNNIMQKGRELISRWGIQFSLQIKPMEMISNLIAKGTSLAAQGGMLFLVQTGRLAFALVISYYLLCERESLTKHLLLMLPISWRNAFLLAASRM